MALNSVDFLDANVLSFDASENGCSVAFSKRGEGEKEIVEYTQESNASSLLAIIDAFLIRIGLNKNEIDLIVASNGPSSFTSLRIEHSIAHAMSLALGKPLLGASSFCGLAMLSSSQRGSLHIVKNAYKNEVYYAHLNFIQNIPMRSEALLSVPLSEIEKIIPVGQKIYVSNAYQSEKIKSALKSFPVFDFNDQPHSLSFGILKYFLLHKKVDPISYPLKAFYVKKPDAITHYEDKHKTKSKQ